MDVAGAEALRQRLAQQEHWQQALAVQLGHQPSIDPDGYALVEFSSATRYYRPRRQTDMIAGRMAPVIRRLCKRLVDGAWEDDVVVEAITHLA